MSPEALSSPGPATESPQAAGRAKRFAVKFTPPCIFLEYVDGSGKTRVREASPSLKALNAIHPRSLALAAAACMRAWTMQSSTPLARSPAPQPSTPPPRTGTQVKMSKVTPDVEADRLTRKVRACMTLS
jgi:hypothetical protein